MVVCGRVGRPGGGSGEQGGDFVHLLVVERAEPERARVLLHLGDGLEAGDGHEGRAAGPQPGERALGQGAAAGGEHLADALEALQGFGLVARAEVPAVPDVVGGRVLVESNLPVSRPMPSGPRTMLASPRSSQSERTSTFPLNTLNDC